MIADTEIHLRDFIKEEHILFLQESTRKGAILRLTSLLQNSNEIFEAIMKREKVVSTGIGMGIALPHARCKQMEDFAICIGICDEGIDWQAIDNLDVKLIMLIAGPDSLHNEYLKILSQITTLLKDSSTRETLLHTKNKSALVKIFQS